MVEYLAAQPFYIGSVTTTRRTNVDKVKYEAIAAIDVSKWGKQWMKYKLTPEHTTFRFRKSFNEETSFMFHGDVCVITLLTDEQTKYGGAYFNGVAGEKGVISFFVDMLKRRESLEIKMDEEVEPISHRQYIHLENIPLHKLINDDWRPPNITRKTFFDVRRVLKCNSISNALPREDLNGVIIPHQCECSYENDGKMTARLRFTPQYLCAIVYDRANLQAYKAILQGILMPYLADVHQADTVVYCP